MLSIVPAFLIFLSSFLQDPSGSWILSAKSSKADFYIKSKYVSKVGSKIIIWTKQVDKVPEEKEGKIIAYGLLLYECDCKNFSTKNLSIIDYSESGEVIGKYNYKDSEMEFAAPGSVGYRNLYEICNRFNKKNK